MKRIVCLLLLWGMMMPLCGFAEEPLPPREYEFTHRAYLSCDTETLKFRMETFIVHSVRCYLTKVWVKDPARQIRKATSVWKEDIQLPKDMARQIPGAALVINGSGYWSPVYPDVPEEYPGDVSDYYFTPWGALTVTDGEVFRDIPDLPYYGLALDADGIQMYTGEATEKVLAASPIQTWSFRNFCPMMRNGESLLPADWNFAKKKARRTVIARVDRNNYLLFSVSDEGGQGLTLHEVNQFFRKHFETEWVYDLDGGPSSALMAWKKGTKTLKTIMGGAAKDIDIMAFAEMEGE